MWSENHTRLCFKVLHCLSAKRPFGDLEAWESIKSQLLALTPAVLHHCFGRTGATSIKAILFLNKTNQGWAVSNLCNVWFLWGGLWWIFIGYFNETINFLSYVLKLNLGVKGVTFSCAAQWTGGSVLTYVCAHVSACHWGATLSRREQWRIVKGFYNGRGTLVSLRINNKSTHLDYDSLTKYKKCNSL